MSRNFFCRQEKEDRKSHCVTWVINETFKMTCPVTDPCFTQCRAVSELQSKRWSSFYGTSLTNLT